ncbi:cytosine-specific methyltransferase [Flavobacterium psychrophilum]|uniref:hypothetical protein n=1 Tax=Flavobacterium psychrophilum TaxID=96345 RepID=UPI00076E813D|nr:hypothetical protein [Flavobacterium psychrophilum]GAQ49277.1 cytosine-specific methyltransferase [Flavobacterium psychrophilum]
MEKKDLKGVKIETISFIAYAQKKSNNNVIEIESYITKEISIKNKNTFFLKIFLIG